MPRNPAWNNIPEELKALPNWIFWRKEMRDGKPTKVPYDPLGGHRASVTNPTHWSTFDNAVRASINGNGIGFVFTLESGYIGIDMDSHVDEKLISYFNSYTEKSQSGTGAHIIIKGELPKRLHDATPGVGRRNGKLEIYATGRYFVFTGDIIHPEPIRLDQAQLDQFILEEFPAPIPIPQVNISNLVNTPDPTILDRIRSSAQADKFNDLFAGNWQKHFASQSEADASLLSILRFWTGGNMDESIALFKQSGLVREKTSRPDYLPRTWKGLTGNVYTPAEPVPQSFLIQQKKALPPWRKITIAHVEESIAGTILEPMVKALCAPTDPPLPIEVGLAKALALCGCALSGPRELRGKLGDYIQRGGDLSRVRILTGGGQTPNIWTLLVGESASGKDIGGIADKAAMQFKWLIGSAGSEEGIADAYIKNPVGLLTISEMLNWLDHRHWQSRAAGFLTHAFNKGWFSHAMSKRGECTSRESDYCFPNICASVQPGIIEAHASKTHLDTGFLGRFIIIRMPNFIAYPKSGSLSHEINTLIDCLKILQSISGEVTPPDHYNEPLNNLFHNHGGQPASTWKRLTAEYGPRLALILSIPFPYTPSPLTITEDGWKRSAILIQYFFAQAEAIIGNLTCDPNQARFEDLCRRIISYLQRLPNHKCWKIEITRNLHNTKAKDRDEALRELVDRGIITTTQAPSGKTSGTLCSLIE